MTALAHPIAGLIFGGGHFTESDVQQTALYFALYTFSLSLWAAQSIYARAFYAAGITWLPLLASTVIVVVAFPLYWMGFHWYGAAGLALASDAGIALQAIALSLLLHQRRMVSLASLEFAEMGRCLLAGLTAGGVVWLLFVRLFAEFSPLLPAHLLRQARWIDLATLLAGSLVWLLVAKGVLEATGSALPRVMMRRLSRR